MATLAAGASANSFLGFGQTVTLTTTHNVSGRWYFVPQNASIPDMNGAGFSFGPLPINVTIGPFDGPGTVYIENNAGSPATLTYTINLGTAYPVNFTSLSASANVNLSPSNSVVTISPTGTGNVVIAPATAGTINNMSIGVTTPAVVKTSNLQATYNDSSGTPGNVTNNSPRGRAAFAAAGSSVVVTNSLVAATSTVLVQLGGTDATLTTVRVTPAAGSFTVTGNAAATATTVFDFLVVN